jgi:DNA polymerase III epsilon subunit-like protein
MYLIFDTETTGLPLSWDAPFSDVDNWPRAVQIAWQVFDRDGRKRDDQCHIIRPDGFTIPQDAVAVHGITTTIARRHGVQLSRVLRMFGEAVDNASILVAHNVSFDAGVLGAEFYRAGKRPPFRRKIQVCTMKSSTEYCALPGYYGFKWPKLSELYRELFGRPPRREHSAGTDVASCARCFFELVRLGIVRLPNRAPNKRVQQAHSCVTSRA